ncbi:SOS response-associated peptidase [Carboxydothermus pertinax]|uniref:Abasic site processing protein n=1 Tax=Carboxydothermus pertinax TaxID=870242 RepID=A0A1L8CXD8_9THEO|nr:SOS response-associated peptidase [Carboxydothermus pertinax]GAV23570.1 DUF159 family protein [Carboxydothermus pertinax]
MCGRFSMAEDFTVLEKLFDLEPIDFPLKPRYNIAPTQDVPVVLWDNGRRLKLFRWGLIPSWAKDPAIGNKMINARAETIDQKPSFKNLLNKKRCLILADGFYEWEKRGRKKIPYRIILKDKRPFAFAGLYDLWRSPEGRNVYSCTIITTMANALVARVHERMPVILKDDIISLWLDSTISDFNLLKSFLVPYPEVEMDMYEVTPLVNSPQNDSPLCFEPLVKLF